jgi:hypothetical protein
MQKFIAYLKEQGFTAAEKVVGPRGAFISASKEDGSKSTFPVGKRSQNGDLAAYNVLVTKEGQAIATVNEYKVAQSITL